MSDDNKPQIIIHKSNWAWQLITVVIFLVILVALMVKNPSERDFAKACVKEYTQRQLNADPAMSELVANLIDQFIGSELALPIESNDYLVCSSFSFDQTLDEKIICLIRIKYGHVNKLIMKMKLCLHYWITTLQSKQNLYTQMR